ncbi:hypothetical protein, partial [Polaribacter gochangensis]|uniref:hypothetical protein n=1 Tax=Polaribacter gochangensis TaxID=3252903 RepID=UPI003904E085
ASRQLVTAVNQPHKEKPPQTRELHQAEYLVRGVGYRTSISDIENAVVVSKDFVSIKIKDIEKVPFGPDHRREI